MQTLDLEQPEHRLGEQPKRSLPVLFHLLDVSRSRRNAAPPAAAEPPAEIAAPVAHFPAPPPAPVHSSDLNLSLPADTLPSVIEPPPAAEPKFALEPAVAQQSLETVAETPAAEPAAVSIPDPTSKLETPPPGATATAPSPRSEAQRASAERRRKLKTPISEDWFAAHGKYIAIAFVLGLAATIYFARTSRRTPPAPEASNLKLDIESGDAKLATSNYKPAATVVANEAASAASPAKLTETAAGPQAELFPPTAAPIAAAAPAESGATDSGDLFPEKQSPATVAARPTGPQEIVNHTLTPAATTAPSATAPPPSAAVPAPEPSYPTTGYPTTGLPAANYPATNPPLPTYPTTASPTGFAPAPPTLPPQPPPYQPSQFQPSQFQPSQFQPSQFQPSAAPPGAAAPPVWSQPLPPGMPPQNQPPFTPAPGTRYERNGSGLY